MESWFVSVFIKIQVLELNHSFKRFISNIYDFVLNSGDDPYTHTSSSVHVILDQPSYSPLVQFVFSLTKLNIVSLDQ
jgi:hypothetical protein